jgi:hypothetical protein
VGCEHCCWLTLLWSCIQRTEHQQTAGEFCVVHIAAVLPVSGLEWWVVSVQLLSRMCGMDGVGVYGVVRSAAPVFVWCHPPNTRSPKICVQFFACWCSRVGWVMCSTLSGGLHRPTPSSSIIAAVRGPTSCTLV